MTTPPRNALLDCSALGEELRQMSDPASRPNTPEAQVDDAELDCLTEEEAEESEQWEEADAPANAFAYDANGNRVGFYLMGEWQPILSTSDMADRALQILRAGWSVQSHAHALAHGAPASLWLLPTDLLIC